MYISYYVGADAIVTTKSFSLASFPYFEEIKAGQ
jgi:hypothetical protein